MEFDNDDLIEDLGRYIVILAKYFKTEENISIDRLEQDELIITYY